MQHHPAISGMNLQSLPLPEPGQHMDVTGATFLNKWFQHEHSDAYTANDWERPWLNEEYFEWIDLVLAIHEARGRFNMVELGAGYGRWAIRGGCYARSLGITDIDLRLVEAEPQHAAWASEALRMNNLHGRLYTAAIAYTGTAVPFLVRCSVATENETISYDAQNWYGQTIGWESGVETQESYFGRPLIRTHAGNMQVMIDPMTLEQVIEGMARVDLIDMDLQGAELDVVKHSIETMTRQVKRVHIGTHGKDIEREIRAIFQNAGWDNVWDFTLLEENDTPYGRCHFNDGISSWLNPHIP